MADDERERLKRGSLLTHSAAKKRRKRETDKQRLESRVMIGQDFERWEILREKEGLTHADFATLLLDRFVQNF